MNSSLFRYKKKYKKEIHQVGKSPFNTDLQSIYRQVTRLETRHFVVFSLNVMKHILGNFKEITSDLIWCE